MRIILDIITFRLIVAAAVGEEEGEDGLDDEQDGHPGGEGAPPWRDRSKAEEEERWHGHVDGRHRCDQAEAEPDDAGAGDDGDAAAQEVAAEVEHGHVDEDDGCEWIGAGYGRHYDVDGNEEKRTGGDEDFHYIQLADRTKPGN